jgi:TRAP-type C4-dicarboxylate transport system permease small subunit
MFSLLHPELVDSPGFWVFAALLVAGAGVVLYVVVRLIRKAAGRGKGH